MRPLALILLVLTVPTSAPAQRVVRRPMDSVDLEVVYVKYFSLRADHLEKRFQGKLGETLKGVKVEEKEWWSRWRVNKEAYRWIGGSSRKVKDHVKREVQVAKRLSTLMDEIGPKTDLKALAAKNGLSYAALEKVTRSTLQLHPDVGSPRAAVMVWGSGVEKLGTGGFKLGHVVPYVTKTKNVYWPRIFDEPGNFMALFRLARHYPIGSKKR